MHSVTLARRGRWVGLRLFALLALVLLPMATTMATELDVVLDRIETLESKDGLDEEVRERALNYYREAEQQLRTAQELGARAQRFQHALDNAPDQTREANERLAAAREAPPIDEQPLLARGEARAEFKQVHASKRAEHAELQKELRELEESLANLQARPLTARDELSAAKARLADLDVEVEAAADAEGLLQEARAAALRAEHRAVGVRVDTLELELLSQEPRIALLEARRDLLAFEVERGSAVLARLQELANLQSRAEAAQAAESAARTKRETGAAHTVLLNEAQNNAELSQRLSALVGDIERSARRQQQVAAELDQINGKYRATRRQLEIAGLNQALAEVLRNERLQLPDPQQYQRDAGRGEQRITEARLEQFRLDQQRMDTPALEERIAQRLDDRIEQALDAESLAQVERELRLLFDDRTALFDELADNYARYIDLLADLRRDEQQLASRLSEYAELLDESLFWTASAPPIDAAWFGGLAMSAAGIATSIDGSALLESAREGLSDQPLSSFGIAAVIALLLGLRGRMRCALRQAAERVGHRYSDRFSHTLRALALLPLLALPWALVLWLPGWLLTHSLDADIATVAAGRALQATAVVAFTIELLRQFCRRDGIAVAHLGWSERVRRLLWHNLSWLLSAALPLTFLIALSEMLPAEQLRDTLGRAAFMVGALAIAWFAYRTLHPTRGVLADLGEASGPWHRIRWLSAPIAVAAPLALAIVAAYGYYYTALQLQSRMFTTGILVAMVGVTFGLVLRWLRLLEHRFALRREHVRRSASMTDEADGEPVDDRAEVDLAAVDAQSRGMLQLGLGVAALAGLWLIWSDLLPALNIFHEIVLWEHSDEGDGPIAVTLANVLLATVLGAVTVMASRTLPGILEISVLPRLSIDAGTRYAITAVIRYVIAVVGLLVVCGLLGISWSKAQWLVAALGLGMGFGLQEIFANFVSGLVILLERPIRVGDTVSLGELSGTVTRIRIRATTVTDWERREIIIPNKTFLTEQLVNWTLSDHVTRVLVQVAVEHRSDPELATRVIMEQTHGNPRIMQDPEPSVYLTGLSNHALNFELRVYVSEMEDRLPIAHELYVGIVGALRRHGIELAHDQHDLHIVGAPRDDQRPFPALSTSQN